MAEQGVRRSSHRRHGWTVRVTVLGTVVAMALAWIPAVALAASLSVSPDKGERGASFTVSGSGYSPGAVVTVLWDGLLPLGVAIADDGGSFSLGTRVPALTGSGAHSVVASTLGDSASARFVVQGEAETTTTTTATTTTTTIPPTTTTVAPSTTTTTTTAPPPPTSTTAPPSTPPTTAPPSGPPTTPPPADPPPSTPPPGPSPTTTAPWVEVVPPTPTTTTTTAPPGDTEATTPGPTTPTDPDADEEPDAATIQSADSENRQSLVLSTEAWIDRLAPEVLAAAPVSGEAPQLSGTRMTVGDFTIRPSTVTAGSTIRLIIDFDQAVAGLSSVVFTLGEHQLGEPVEVTGERLDVEREVPYLPGRQVVQLRAGEAVLGEVPIVIVDLPGSGPGLSAGAMLVLLAGVSLTLAALAIRTLRPSVEYGTTFGLRPTLSRWRRRLSALRR